MIVKCQRSLETNEAVSQLLFYNEGRDMLAQFDNSHDWNKHFGKTTAPHDNKFYAEVEWTDIAEQPKFVRKVKAQNW